VTDNPIESDRGRRDAVSGSHLLQLGNERVELLPSVRVAEPDVRRAASCGILEWSRSPAPAGRRVCRRVFPGQAAHTERRVCRKHR
jgi:hypothetical protein